MRTYRGRGMLGITSKGEPQARDFIDWLQGAGCGRERWSGLQESEAISDVERKICIKASQDADVWMATSQRQAQ
jgi:hypothetical protein